MANCVCGDVLKLVYRNAAITSDIVSPLGGHRHGHLCRVWGCCATARTGAADQDAQFWVHRLDLRSDRHSLYGEYQGVTVWVMLRMSRIPTWEMENTTGYKGLGLWVANLCLLPALRTLPLIWPISHPRFPFLSSKDLLSASQPSILVFWSYHLSYSCSHIYMDMR